MPDNDQTSRLSAAALQGLTRSERSKILRNSFRMSAAGGAPAAGGDAGDIAAPAPSFRYPHVAGSGHSLPPAAAETLAKLRQAKDDAGAIMGRSRDARIEASTDLLRAQTALRSLTAARSNGGGGLVVGDPQVARQAAVVEAKAAEMKRVEAVHAKHCEAWTAAAATVSQIESWLGELPNTAALADVPLPAPSLRKGEIASTQIDLVRGLIEGLKQQLAQVQQAPRPSSEAVASMRREVEALAQRARPEVAPLLAADATSSLVWPITRNSVPVISPETAAIANVQSVDALGLLCWLHGPALIKALETEIVSQSNDKSAMTDTDRAKRITHLENEIIASARQEEALCRHAEATGLSIVRRADCDVRAILSVTMEAAPAPAEAPRQRRSLFGYDVPRLS